MYAPGRLALLRRCAIVADVTVEERDRILRVVFPTLPYERTLQVLREVRDLHNGGHATAAEQVLESLLSDVEKP